MIHILLSADWELRGDGSGDLHQIQLEPARRLMDALEDSNLRGVFNAEVMQQLAHRRFGLKHPQLAALADEWDAIVKEMISRGHDVQVHVHPQWEQARYQEGRWVLGDQWSILRYEPTTVRRMISECRSYLESLLRSVDRTYKCVSFRAGSWSIAPGPDILPILIENGIQFDMSIVAGLHYELEMVELDYRSVEEPFLPYYPRLDDARRVADSSQPIVCVPTHSFVYEGWFRFWLIAAGWALRKISPGRYRQDFVPMMRSDVSTDQSLASYAGRWTQPSAAEPGQSNETRFSPIFRVSDLSSLSWVEMAIMLRSIRNSAHRAGVPTVPVILENHPKDIGDFSALKRLYRKLAATSELSVVTARELAQNITDGIYAIRTRANG